MASRVSSPSWKRAGLKPSFQHGASHPRKKGLFPRVGSNWMGGTIVSAVREAGIRCRTANQMRRASKFIVQAFATAAHVHCERSVSAQTLRAGRFFFIMIIPRYCGLGVGISLGLSVNESSMPPIAHVCRGRSRRRESLAWIGSGVANMKIQAYLTAATVNLKRLTAAIALLLMLLPNQRSPSCTAT
jgi:hypothetical protein